jgi:hypothetical protein
MDWQTLNGFLDRSLQDASPNCQPHRMRNIRSKYDYLSIRVQIDQYEYVFSRFSLSRYLMACMVPPSKAVDISRRIKEEFVDMNRFEVRQDEVTARVFELISEFGNAAVTQRRFRLIQNFNLERIPLIIFISGTGFLGKSTLAFQLGERLNISTILQTDIVCALASNSGDLGKQLWYTDHGSEDDFFSVYQELARVAAGGIEGDIVKTLTDGKPLIVEGIHLDPELYLRFCGQNSLNPLAGFNPSFFGREVKGKQGFILPVLLTRDVHDIQASLRNSIFGSPEKRHLAHLLPKIEKNALALQSALRAKFPKEFIIDLPRSDSPSLPRSDSGHLTRQEPANVARVESAGTVQSDGSAYAGLKPIDLIHTLFLEKLDVYYKSLNR